MRLLICHKSIVINYSFLKRGRYKKKEDLTICRKIVRKLLVLLFFKKVIYSLTFSL